MATALKLRADIKKLKAAIASSKTPKNFVPKLKTQLDKAENELSAIKGGAKPRKVSTAKGSKTLLERAKALVKKNNKFASYKGSGVDLEKDAKEGARETGRRVSKGIKGNQYATKKEAKGNVYYEYRVNRLDIKQPKGKQSYPKLEDGGYMAKGGNITKGKKYISHWKSQNGDKNYDFVEIIDTNATSNKVGYFGKVVKYKVVESSDKKRIGKIEEDTKDTINTLLKNHLWESYADGGYMAKGGFIADETIELNTYNFEGKIIRSGKIEIDYKNSLVKFPSGKIYKVVEDYEYTYKIQKTQIKARNGIKGFVDFLHEINKFDSPFNRSVGGAFIELGKMGSGGYMAKGGIVEHGLKVGDLITGEGEKGTDMDGYIFVSNHGEDFVVNLKYGLRSGKMAHGGQLGAVHSKAHRYDK